MMDAKQRKILIGVIVCVLASWLVIPLLLSGREQPVPLSRTPLLFDAAQAYRAVEQFVTTHPTRVLGSLESRQSTGYIRDYLENLGYEISYGHFEATINRRIRVGRNVIGYRQGKSPEILVLVAHFDNAPTSVQGAMDNGSGVGVLLELARVMAASPINRSLLVIFSDGKEWGTLGAMDVAATHPERHRIAAVLSLDHVAPGDLAAFCLREDGLTSGFTPPWLRELARQAGEQQGLPVRAPALISEHLQRSFYLAWADQGPFLHARIPAITLGSESKDRERQKAVYHSAGDTIENLKLSSIEKYGLVSERIARTLDELQSIPDESFQYFRLWGSSYLNPAAVRALHIISFLPLPVILWFQFRKNRKRLNADQVGRELLALMATLPVFWVIFLAVWLAKGLRLLPIYSLYPAVKDPVLTSPPLGVLGGIFGSALFVAVVSWIVVGYSLRSFPKPDYHASRQVLLTLLLVYIVLGLLYNSYWAMTFLLFPAWIWALTGPADCLKVRIRNRILIAAAAIPYATLLWVYGSRLELGWNFAWYQLLAIGNGMFTASAFFLGTAMAALGIRFLVIQSHRPE